MFPREDTRSPEKKGGEEALMDDIKAIQAPNLVNQSDIAHGFGTRWGPASGGPPYDRVTEALGGAVTGLAHVKQIHGSSVLEASSAGLAGEGDSPITREPGLLVGVRTADCVPILLFDPSRKVVAAVHAGWRGTAAQVIRRTVKILGREHGCSTANLLAAIGPSIGRCCYEVGSEVVEQLGESLSGVSVPAMKKANGAYMLDLRAVNTVQLLSDGVDERNLWVSDACTFCRSDLFYSYRRSGAYNVVYSVLGRINEGPLMAGTGLSGILR